VHRVVCASPGYLQSHGIPATPQDLTRHSCISFTGLGSPDRWGFSGPDGGQTISVTPRLTVTTAEAALDAAIGGLGLTRILSYQAASAQAAGLLQVVLTEWQPEAIPVSMVYDGQGALPLKLRALLDYAGPRLKRRLSALQI
jgi:DNA-binding transcriptional LysR family regulator